jgi:DNA-binding transcriptional regulator YbjK
VTESGDTRRQRLADAALDVVADGGMRALTHRAVDARTGFPAGTTSAYFRTREALVVALADRISDLDQSDVADLDLVAGGDLMGGAGAPPAVPALLEAVAANMAALAHHLMTTAGRRSLVRYACLLETTHRPALRGMLRHTEAARVQTAELLTWAGAPRPEESARTLVAAVDGLILDGVLDPPAPDLDRTRRAVRRLLNAALAPDHT